MIGKSAFNNYSDAKYVGYMYGSSIDDTANTYDSTIKGVIDTWYQNNMTSYTSQLEDTVFCNDRSYTTSDSIILLFGSYTRLKETKTPTLKCQNTKDKFTVNTSNGNGALTYPIGLITADEIAYAGGVDGIANSSFYFKDEQWVLSPSIHVGTSNSSAMTNVVSPGYMGNRSVTNSSGVRPSISLKPGAAISSGNGTATSPYIVN